MPCTFYRNYRSIYMKKVVLFLFATSISVCAMERDKQLQHAHLIPNQGQSQATNIKSWFQAARDGDIESLQQRYQEDATKINERNHAGFTPLRFAIHANNIEAVKWLLNHGAEMLITDPNNYNALHAAQYAKEWQRLTHIILEHACTKGQSYLSNLLSMHDKDGYLPQHIAFGLHLLSAQLAQVWVTCFMKYELMHCLSKMPDSSFDQNTPLEIAAHTHNIHLIIELIKYALSHNSTDQLSPCISAKLQNIVHASIVNAPLFEQHSSIHNQILALKSKIGNITSNTDIRPTIYSHINQVHALLSNLHRNLLHYLQQHPELDEKTYNIIGIYKLHIGQLIFALIPALEIPIRKNELHETLQTIFMFFQNQRINWELKEVTETLNQLFEMVKSNDIGHIHTALERTCDVVKQNDWLSTKEDYKKRETLKKNNVFTALKHREMIGR